MDTSPEYINMCRKAKELQKMWKPETGDFYKLSGHFITCIVLKNSLIDVNATWLPRIDQWLQILSDKNIIFGLSNYAQGDSVEITCIKLLYQNLYNKSWNGKDWTCTSNTTA